MNYEAEEKQHRAIAEFTPPDSQLPVPFQRIQITYGGAARPEIHAVWLGVGSEGTVWRCWMVDCPETRLAIKFYPKESGLRMFELRSHELAIRHPSFLKVLDYVDLTASAGAIEKGWLPFAKITELADCSLENLLHEVSRSGIQINWRVAWRIVEQLLDGLVYFHEEMNFCHRDIHPRNLFLQGTTVEHRLAVTSDDVLALARNPRVNLLIGDLGVAATVGEQNAVPIRATGENLELSNAYNTSSTVEQDAIAFADTVREILDLTEKVGLPEDRNALQNAVQKWLENICFLLSKREVGDLHLTAIEDDETNLNSDESERALNLSPLVKIRQAMPLEEGFSSGEFEWLHFAEDLMQPLPAGEKVRVLSTFIRPLADHQLVPKENPLLRGQLKRALLSVLETHAYDSVQICLLNPVVHVCSVRDCELMQGDAKEWSVGRVSAIIGSNLVALAKICGLPNGDTTSSFVDPTVRPISVRLYATSYQSFYVRTYQSIRLSFYSKNPISETRRYKQSIFAGLAGHLEEHFLDVWNHALTVTLEEYWQCEVKLTTNDSFMCFYLGPAPKLLHGVPLELQGHWFSRPHGRFRLALRRSDPKDQHLLDLLLNERQPLQIQTPGIQFVLPKLSFNDESCDQLQAKYGDKFVSDRLDVMFVEFEEFYVN